MQFQFLSHMFCFSFSFWKITYQGETLSYIFTLNFFLLIGMSQSKKFNPLKNITLNMNLGGNDLLCWRFEEVGGSIYSKCCGKQVQHLSELPEIELVCERKRSSAGSAGQHAAVEHFPYVFGFLLGQCIDLPKHPQQLNYF